MKTENAVPFDPKNDINYAITPGVYPAHAIKMTEKGLKGNSLYVYNIVFRIAEEAEDMPVVLMKQTGEDRHLEALKDSKGKDQMGFASAFIGREIRNNGVFFSPNIAEGEGWKNNNYRDLCKNLNIEIPVEDGIEYLGRLEEDEDVIGKPCKIKVDVRQYDKKDGSKAYSLNVVETFRWEGGEMLSDDIMNSLISENESSDEAPGF